MESFVLHEIELKNVDCSSPIAKSLSLMDDSNFNFDQLDTKLGQIYIYRQGCEFNKNRPVLITYHDIGLNSVSNFQAFFNYSEMKLMLKNVSVIHLTAIGQEDNAPNYPSVSYPTLDELADQILEVCDRFKIKTFIGFGVGAGANILSRFALKNPSYLEGLVLINSTASVSSWTEWLYQKLNIYYLSSTLNGGLTSFPEATRNYLMWHHFGTQDETRNYDLYELYKSHFIGKTINAHNLSLFIDSFIRRTDLGIYRSDLNKNFKCPILLIVGSLSPHIHSSVDMNSRIDPANSTWLKLQNCGMVLEEEPGKVVEALKLFIQGLGYALTNFDKERNLMRNSLDSLTDDYSLIVNGHHSYLNECEVINENIRDLLNDGDKKSKKYIEKIEYGPPPKDGRIIENPIENC